MPEESPARPATPPGTPPAKLFAVFFQLGAVALVAAGLMRTFQVADLVGGDAYNFQIAAARGLVLIGAGIVASLIGVALTVHAARK
jgi:hypothetical protein